jgi:hypothetical protein
VEPEWIKAGEREPRSRNGKFNDEFSEQLAWLLDSSIRIGRFSIGLDALIGLIPGLGDVVTNLFSGMIVMRAMQNGVPHSAIMRMLLNMGIDTAVGSIPIVGDIFDFAYKANTKNLRIYRESLSGARKPLKDWGFVVMVVAILLAMLVLPILGMIYLLQLVISWLQ